MTTSAAVNTAPTPIPAAPRRRANLRLVSTRPRLVLVRDEGTAVRSELAVMLDDAGFDVVGQAGEDEQAVAMTADLRPDAALLQAGSPAGGGFHVASQISRQQTPVVMLAGRSGPDHIKAALAAGVMAYVVEPFSPERVLPAIEMAVARHAEATALRHEVTGIAQRLDARKVIERAKGLLMTQETMTEPEAFRFIQRTAMDRRVSMRDVATALVDRLAHGQ